MGHDLVIRNGNIVDGSGAAAFIGDVAIDGDRISTIGKVDGYGREEIQADGLTVTPGFIDLHTHLDAQTFWDPMLTSVTWHGVTTALLGNCGLTFAPCRPVDREFLTAMMETMLDIPRNAILSGLPWNWESYGSYLDALEALEPVINVTGLVGHCATRFSVMGLRSVEEPATPEEIQQIAELVGQAVKDGALGFSTSRSPGHVMPDGRSMPGTHAHPDELRAIARAVGKHDGIMQTVINNAEIEVEMDLLAEEARTCRAVLFSAVAGPTSELGDRLNRRVSAMRDKGLDLAARYAAIRNEDTRETLIEEVRNDAQATRMAESMYWLGDGDRPIYTHKMEENLLHMANAAGEHPAETWLRLTLESDGRALFHLRLINVNLDTLEELITTEWAMPSLCDAGAHVSQMIDSGWATFVLSHWHRDCAVYSLSEAVRRITSEPARVLGLSDRGTLAVGKRADINVFDLDRLAECMPYLVHDLPCGASRFVQRAVGKTLLIAY